MSKKYTLTEEEYQEIVKINEEGGDPVMFLSGGRPMGRSLHEKVNDYWTELARKRGFIFSTVRPTGGDVKEFYADEVSPAPKEAGNAV